MACVNQRYAGAPVPNPWATLAYGPDGPVDYKDPQHFENAVGPYEQLSRNNRNYDPEFKIPSNNVEDTLPEPIKSWVGPGGGEKLWINPTAPPLRYPNFQEYRDPHTETDGSEKSASANTSGNDDNRFSSSLVGDDGTSSFDHVFDGSDASTVASNLDLSILDPTAGDTFDLAGQADLGAFDLTSDNIASAPDGGSDLWSSSTLTPSPDFALGDNSDLWSSSSDDIASLSGGDSPLFELAGSSGDGSSDQDLFSKRSRTRARDFRY